MRDKNLNLTFHRIVFDGTVYHSTITASTRIVNRLEGEQIEFYLDRDHMNSVRAFFGGAGLQVHYGVRLRPKDWLTLKRISQREKRRKV